MQEKKNTHGGRRREGISRKNKTFLIDLDLNEPLRKVKMEGYSVNDFVNESVRGNLLIQEFYRRIETGEPIGHRLAPTIPEIDEVVLCTKPEVELVKWIGDRWVKFKDQKPIHVEWWWSILDLSAKV